MELEKKRTVEDKVQKCWSSSSEEEAIRLINLMISTPSRLWFDMVFKAERREIEHWRLLLQYKEQLSAIAADAVASEDGQVVIKNE